MQLIESLAVNVIDNIKLIVNKIKRGFKLSPITSIESVYHGENGIDNLNKTLQTLLIPNHYQKELLVGDIIYREQDKYCKRIKLMIMFLMAYWYN